MSEHSSDSLAQLQENLEALSQRHAEWRKDRDDKHRRGLNDLNVFTILRSAHEEVALHSRFIAFLLDPNGAHGQGDLFLRLFMEECGHPDFKIKTTESQVRCEYQNIDIYITDGSNHVIIENKVWAKDQWRQIERYIEIISGEGGGIDQNQEVVNSGQEATDENRLDDDESENNDILVIYLSLDKPTPTGDSLGGWGVEGNYLVRGDQRCMYKNLHYRPLKNNGEPDKGIWTWLSKSHNQIRNITNLSVAITQYREVIDKLYGRYEGNTMNFLEYLGKVPDGISDLAKVEKLLSKIDVWEVRKQLARQFWDSVITGIENRLKGSKYENFWEVYVTQKTGKQRWYMDGRARLEHGIRGGLPLQVRVKGKKEAYFAFEYRPNHKPNNHHGILVGVFQRQIPNIENTEFKWDQSPNETRPDRWGKELSPNWPCHIKKYLDILLVEVIEESVSKEKGEDAQDDPEGDIVIKAAEILVSDFMDFFECFEESVRKRNSI